MTPVRDYHNAPFYKLSNYVVPSERKRDDLIYRVRMRLVHAGMHNFERPVKKDKSPDRRRPKSAFTTVQAKVDTGKKGVKVNKR